jgi:hypothetical protein
MVKWVVTSGKNANGYFGLLHLIMRPQSHPKRGATVGTVSCAVRYGSVFFCSGMHAAEASRAADRGAEGGALRVPSMTKRP